MFEIVRRPQILLTGLLVCALVVGGTMLLNRAHASDQKKPPAATSPYAAVAEGKADVEGGIIQVASRSAGVVRDVVVREGDTVVKDQVLARQEADAPRLAVQTAQANLDQVKARRGEIEVQLNTALRERARLSRLGGVVSGQSIDQAADAFANANASLATQHAAMVVAQTQLNEARYRLEQTVIRAPVNGLIVRRYANPGTGASTLNVTPMFDLEPAGGRIVRAEVAESALGSVVLGQAVNIVAEADQSKAYTGKVLRRAAVFGARKLQSDDPAERTDERVVEVVVSADTAPFLVGQRVLVKFFKPTTGQK